MPREEEAHPLASRGSGQAASLGPHVVGTRIVVRRLLRGVSGPSGGPAFTDLLGTCLSWDDGVCTVQPESGEPVSIPVADIVSGKPVPPRPSVRRRVSAREAEGHVSGMFPDVVVEPLGEWLLRSDPAPLGRLFKRANSCLALGDPGVPFAEAEAVLLDWYAQRGRDPLVQVEAGSAVEAAFHAADWEQHTVEVELRMGSLSGVRRARRGRGGDRTVVVADGSRVTASVPGDAGPLAEGQAVLDGDWLGLHALKVRVEERRRGLAGDVVDALLEWGAEQGALTVWLHVEADNLPARALYDSLGLEVHHVVRYLVPR